MAIRTICLCILLFVGIIHSANSTTLVPNVTQTHAIQRGEKHEYLVTPTTSELWIEIAQNGIDIRSTVQDLPRTTNSPLLDLGNEYIAIESGRRHEIIVEVADKNLVKGEYSITLRAVTGIDEMLRQSITAADLESTDDRVSLYDRCYAISSRLELRHHAARCLFAKGMLLKFQSENQESLQESLAALTLAENLYLAGNQTRMATWVAYWRGSVLSTLGDYGSARDVFSSALEKTERTPDLRLSALLKNYLGLMHHIPGDLRTARRWYEEAASGLPGDRYPVDSAMIQNNLGGIHFQRGEASEALANFQAAEKHYRLLDNKPRIVEALTNAARAQTQLANYDAALSTVGEAHTLNPTDPVLLASLFEVAGIANYGLGDYERANDFFTGALTHIQSTDNRASEASLRVLMAQSLADNGKPDEALEHAVFAFKHYRSTSALSGELSAHAIAARIYLDLNDTQHALEQLQMADDLLEANQDLADHLPVRARVAFQHGRVHKQLDQRRSASKRFQQALNLYRSMFQEVGQVSSLVELAAITIQHGNYEKTLSHLSEAEEIALNVRHRIANGSQRAKYVAALDDLYHLRVAALVGLAKTDQTMTVEAYEASENGRARVLKEQLRQSGVQEDATTTQNRELTARYTALLVRREQLFSRTNDSKLLADLLLEISKVESQLHQIHPTEASPLEVFSANRLQKSLGPDEVVLHFDLGNPDSFVWTLTNKTIKVRKLPNQRLLAELALEVRKDFVNLTDSDESKSRLMRLSDILIAQDAPSLRGKTVFVVADGALHTIPFSALVTKTKLFRQPERLIDTAIPIVVPASELLLKRSAAKTWTKPKISVVADPVYVEPQTAMAKVAWRSSNTMTLRSLPHSLVEAQTIANLFGSDVTVKSGKKATIPAVRDLFQQDIDILHFATHGQASFTHPGTSGLALTNTETDDGILRLSSIYRENIKARLIVLSGCDTAVGNSIRSEGPTSLARGFIHAGATQVIATLWRVPDRVTAEFMATFYQLLKENPDPAKALTDAQKQLRKNYPSPFYWAAFTMIGT